MSIRWQLYRADTHQLLPATFANRTAAQVACSRFGEDVQVVATAYWSAHRNSLDDFCAWSCQEADEDEAACPAGCRAGIQINHLELTRNHRRSPA